MLPARCRASSRCSTTPAISSAAPATTGRRSPRRGRIDRQGPV
jgi:hypothetical protein